MPCKTKSECYYGRDNQNNCNLCPRERGYNLADDFDDMIQSKPIANQDFARRLGNSRNTHNTIETVGTINNLSIRING